MKKALLVVALAFSFPLFSQSLKEITLEDAVLNRFSTFYPERLPYFQWIPSSSEYLYAINSKPKQLLKGKNGEPFISQKEINALLDGKNGDTIKSLNSVKPVSNSLLRVETAKKAYYISPKEKKVNYTLLKSDNGAHYHYAPDENWVAYTIENNLYLQGKAFHQRITSETNPDIVYGHAVHRYEFGIMEGIFWSPTSKAIAFYRNDQTTVSDYPLVDISSRPAKVKNIKYPMAGMKSEEVTLGVYHLETGETVYLQTGEPKEQYLTNVAWGPNGEYIYVAVLNRDQNHLKMNRYRASDGSFDKTLFEEKHDKYVQPLHPIQFIPGDESNFIWQSERDGFNHLYLFNTNGKVVRQLTSGPQLVTEVIGFDEKAKQVLVQTTAENGLSRILKWINLRNGKERLVSPATGTSNGKLSEKGDLIYHTYTSYDTPLNYEVLNTKGSVIHSLLKAKNPLEEYQVAGTEMVTLKAADGKTDLNARIIKPHKFLKSKRYPVLVYVYNGPNVQLLTNRFLAGAPMWMHYFANQGYIVFTIDGRGSENRGLEFENVIFRQCGEVEMEDQLIGIDYLSRLSYVDTSRMAVHGWSYGGFMTTSLMLKKPGTFDVGVSGGGVMDWKYYEVMYTERYMDTPETNPEGFEKTSLLNKTQNLEGKLLVIHDSNDDTVVPQHAEDFLKSCVDNGVQVDFFWYPGHPHNVRGKDRVHLMRKVLNYVDENLTQ